MENTGVRESFKSNLGFILSCIGSAVGMANIWMFPYRIGQFGGGAFLILYVFFTFLIGVSGIMGEIAFGRAMKSGPIGAFSKAYKNINCEKAGKFLGFIPVIGSFGIAVGYSVIIGWILKFLVGSVTGEVTNPAVDVSEQFSALSSDFGSLPWHFLAIFITAFFMFSGVSKGIEKINKVMMPIFFIVFFILAIRVMFLPNSIDGYKYLFNIDVKYFFDPKTWVYALGQSFFSISLAGSGLLIYGSYLDKYIDVLDSAKKIAIFDTIAALLSALIIIPAVFSFGYDQTSGPALLFITIPNIFKEMFGGQFIAVIFFISVLFAGITSLMNLFEVAVDMLSERAKMSRKLSLIISSIIIFGIGIFFEGNLLTVLMDTISIYIVPLGAVLAGFSFFWVFGIERAKEQVELGRSKKFGKSFIFLTKYLFCFVSLLVYILGIFYGGIG